MAHRGQRSPEAEVRRLIKHEIYSSAFVDKEKAETVCRTCVTEVITIVTVKVSSLKISDIPDIFHGLILHDPNGKGVFDSNESPEQIKGIF